MRCLILILCVMLATTPTLAQVTTSTEMLRSSVQNVIRPAFKAFAARAEETAGAVDALCATPSPETLESARASFAEAATAYGQIEFLRLGPLLEDNRADRLLFWPDRKGIALKQVQALLAGEDQASIAPERIENASVAIQGLGALEFVLYGTGAEELSTDAPFRCAFGAAIARNLTRISGELAAGWTAADGIAAHLMQPDPSYVDYRTQTEAIEAMVGVMAHGIEAMRDQRVLPFISRDGKPAKPKQALFWRSGLTMPMLLANIDGVRRLLGLSGIVTDAQLAAQIDSAFDAATQAIAEVTMPVEAAVEDPAHAAALERLVRETQELQRLIGEELTASLGLSVGFSSADGD